MNISDFVRKLAPKKKFYDPQGELVGVEKWIDNNVWRLRQNLIREIEREKDNTRVTDDVSIGVRLGLARAALLIHNL